MRPSERLAVALNVQTSCAEVGSRIVEDGGNAEGIKGNSIRASEIGRGDFVGKGKRHASIDIGERI